MVWLLIKDIRLPITEDSVLATDFALKKLYALMGRENVGEARIYKKSVDARRRDSITAVYSVAVSVEGVPEKSILEANAISVIADSDVEVVKGNRVLDGRPVVVGNGPCGMFCALLLAENGYRPIVIERGDSVENRTKAVDDFYKTKVLDTESNIQFGAGGAGTFSDGKLVTRISDPRCRYVLRRFADFGAPESILTLAKPHIGTDMLVQVVARINRRIEELGAEIMYRTALTGFDRSAHGRITAVKTTRGDIQCGAVILATGNSARDVYSYLLKTDILKGEMWFSYDAHSMANMVPLMANQVRDIIEMNKKGQKAPSLLNRAEKEKAPEFLCAAGEESISRFDENKSPRKKNHRHKNKNRKK